MPIKREIDVYQFDELPAKVKQRVIEAYREHAWDAYNTEALNNIFREQLESLGLPSSNIRWSLSFSQGDGVAFYGKFDIEDYLKANKLMKEFGALRALDPLPYAEIVKVGSHMYDHWNTMRVHLGPQTDLTPKKEALLSALREQIAQHIQVVSRGLEKIGYDEIEYQTSDEQIAEILRSNEYDARGYQI